jgi:dienelactone hydrolase
MSRGGYDPFAPGACAVDTDTLTLPDPPRGRQFACEVWRPAHRPDAGPLVVYSHYAGGHRRAAAFLATHLAGHGYVVAAVDHSETFVPELRPGTGEDDDARARRIAAVVGSRVPDVQLALDRLHTHGIPVGLVGHSLGGWTVLAAADVDPRVDAVVAMAPGGSEHPTPGVLRMPLAFTRRPAAPTLFLAAENDVPVPLDDVLDVYHRAGEPRQLVVLRRADHQHFVDDVAGDHEALRAMTLPGEAAWMPAAMLPMARLTPPEQAHAFTRGLTLAHLDAHLREDARARAWLASGVAGRVAARKIDAWELLGPVPGPRPPAGSRRELARGGGQGVLLRGVGRTGSFLSRRRASGR